MDLLDRYLAAVAALLPKDQRDDIIAELRDLLLNQMEEKEAQAGRPLTDAEREAVLRAFGHPIAVAGRYGPSRALIGPELYPFYMFAVKGLLILAAVVTAIPLVISIIIGGEDPSGGIGRFLSGFITSAMTLIGAATIVGAGIERGWIPLGKVLDWKVADLPRLDARAGRGAGPKAGAIKSRAEAAFELAVLVLFILWWTGLAPPPWSVVAGEHGVFLTGAPIWSMLHWPVLALAVAQAMAALTTLVRPDWARVRAALDILGDLGGLALAVVLWRAGRMVEVSGADPAAVAGLQAALDLSFHYTAAVMAVVCLGKLAFSLWRLARGAGRPREAVA